MNNKLIFLNVCSFQIPCKIIILSPKNEFLEELTLKSFCSKINICTKGEILKLVAKHKNQTVYKTIYLSDFACQNVFANFAFDKSFSNRILRLITLKDANYGFDVLQAILSFKQQSS